ncbi:MAG: SAM-dependent methyltransferase [Bacteroidota bacterium]|nr:SAM-dependent methyltransferase [Bacteroidota bacterium]
MMKKKGKLYLLPSEMGNSDNDYIIPAEVQKITVNLKYFIVENLRTARRFLKKTDKSVNIDELTFYELNKHTDRTKVSNYLAPANRGRDIGLLSEAGNPCIADPGRVIVQMAHEQNIRVVPTVGPSSIILALIASGMNGQNFAFTGYLPIDAGERKQRLLQLENRSVQENQSQIFMEAPYRNQKLLHTIVRTCSEKTKLTIAADITLETEFILTRRIKSWKKELPEINKRPAIFVIHG